MVHIVRKCFGGYYIMQQNGVDWSIKTDPT